MRKFLIGLLIFIFLIGVVILGAAIWFNKNIDAVGDGSTIKEIIIEKNAGIVEISNMLYEQGLIKNEELFYNLLKISGAAGKIQAGSHILNDGMDVWEIIDILQEPVPSATISITIPEGYNIYNIAMLLSGERFQVDIKDILYIEEDIEDNPGNQQLHDALNELGIDTDTKYVLWGDKIAVPDNEEPEDIELLRQSINARTPEAFMAEFINLCQNSEIISDYPIPDEAGSVEGYLFPSTYYIVPTFSAEDIIRHLIHEFFVKFNPDDYADELAALNNKVRNELIESIKQKRNMSDDRAAEFLNSMDNIELSFHDVITLASMVEKEAKLDEERVVIAEVYLNRLSHLYTDNNSIWRLECDPTFIYALQKAGCMKPDEYFFPKSNSDRSPECWLRINYNIRDRNPEYCDFSPNTFLVYNIHRHRFNHPYNTYYDGSRGLPPGPIANPGAESVIASFNPASHDYFFMFSPEESDGHCFSENFSGHRNCMN